MTMSMVSMFAGGFCTAFCLIGAARRDWVSFASNFMFAVVNIYLGVTR